MDKKYAFIDESGNEGMDLGNPGVSRYYVIAALVFDEGGSARALSEFQEIKDRHFKNREMKSAAIKYDGRRLDIIREIVNVPCAIYLLIADKVRLSGPGFQYAKSFIKYLQGCLYEAVIKDAPHDPSFVTEFEEYLNNRNQRNLFSQWNLRSVKSEDDICIQVADVIAGTVARGFERSQIEPRKDELIELLLPRIVYMQEFPRRNVSVHDVLPGGNHDGQIEMRSIHAAWEFVDRYGDSEDRERQLQVTCLRELLRPNLGDDDSWVATDTLRGHLEAVCGELVSEHKLRHVIGGIRDAGVLVASKASGGYKIPTTEMDLVYFLERQNSMLSPMISRVQKAREIVKRATGGELDILGYDEYASLKAAVDAVEEFRLLPDPGGN